MDGFSEEDLPVAIGHVLGLRWFQLTLTDPVTRDERPTLVGSRGPWKPGLNTATCLREAHLMAVPSVVARDHHVPVRHCGCGFWAYWHLGDQMADAPHVAGLIKGSGHVIKGPQGFRCEKAEILALVPLIYDQNAALALEAVYGVDVYGTIGALLEMHKAPPTQIPLADDYFCKKGTQEDQRRGWYPVSLSAPDMAPCLKCGAWACKTGQALCGPCETARAKAHELLAAEAGKAILGLDAVDQLHARREGWAKMTPSILIPPTSAETEAIVRQKADTSAVRASLDYIKARFGDGSWWRTLQHPDK